MEKRIFYSILSLVLVPVTVFVVGLDGKQNNSILNLVSITEAQSPSCSNWNGGGWPAAGASCVRTAEYDASDVNSAAYTNDICYAETWQYQFATADDFFITCEELRTMGACNGDDCSGFFQLEGHVYRETCRENGNPSNQCIQCGWYYSGVFSCPDYDDPSTPPGGGAPDVTLVASPPSITSGQNSTLSWTVSGGATSCTASGGWSGSKSTSGGTEVRPNITSNQTYTITCSNSNGSDSATATVTVTTPPPSGPTAVCSPSSQTVYVGQTVSLTGVATGPSPIYCMWTAAGGAPNQSYWATNNCNSFSTTYNTPGVKSINYQAQFGFGPIRNNTCTVNVQALPAAPVVSLTANPATVNSGGSSTLTWTVSGGATSCTASGGWSGSKTVTGGSEVRSNLTSSQSYTITCSNAGGSGSASASVTVNPPVASATCAPVLQNAQVGQTVNFSGTATGQAPITCYWNTPGGSPANSGGASAGLCSGFSTVYNTPGTYRAGYMVIPTAQSPQYGYCDTVVTVTPPNTPPTVTLDANPSTVDSGDDSTLTWTVSNATSCTATGDWAGSKSVTGGSELQTNITSNKTYTLTCTNAYGSTPATETVTVNTSGPSLSGSCAPETSTVEVGENIRFLGTYSPPSASCTWYNHYSPGGSPTSAGTLSPSKCPSFTATYSSAGTKTVSYAINSGGSQISRTCSVQVVDPTPPPANHELTTIRTGQGTVTSNPPGINCGGSCTAQYADGTQVTLTATPNQGWRFVGWGGDCSGTDPQCTLTIDGPKSVTANFRPNLLYEEF